MKKYLLFLVLLSVLANLSAQPCAYPEAKTTLHANNIAAGIFNNGSLFGDNGGGKFITNPAANGTGASTIYRAGLWLGGLDIAGNLKLLAVTYNMGGAIPYVAGPLLPGSSTDSTACNHWDHIFKVQGSRIAAFLDSLPFLVNDPSLAELQFPDIMGWPASGNPFFTDIQGFELPTASQGLAPFRDINLDGAYNPLQGDYPAVQLHEHDPFVPAEINWCVFSSQEGVAAVAFPLEIQLTAWAFDCVDQPVLNNTIFTAHKFIFHTETPIDSFYIAMWVDLEIGCAADDYTGVAQGLQSFYAYNQDAIDGDLGQTCSGGGPTFINNPPVQSATFLNLSLDKYMNYNNATSAFPPPSGTEDPNSADEYYHYMTGHWRDGLPLTYGGTGRESGSVQTDYAFPGDPADPDGWSMCTANIVEGDRRVLGSHKVGQLLPGQIEELDVAWTLHPNPNLPCGLGTTFADIANVRSLYNHTFKGVCMPVTGTTLPQLDASVLLAPNPAANHATVEYGNLLVLEIRCIDAAGRLIYTVHDLPSHQYTLDVTGWKAGAYTMQLVTRTGSLARRLVVLQ